MKIAYLSCVFPPYPGGIGILAKGMREEMKKRGYQTEVFAPFHPFRPLLRYGNAAFIPQLFWRLRGFDIIHLLYPFFGMAEFLPLIRKISKAKIVIHHTMDAVAPGFLGKIFDFHSKYIMPRIFRAADCVLVLSEDYWKNSEVGKLCLKNVEIVPNGVDTDRFRPIGQIGPISPIVLFVGGLDRAHYFKGVDVLLNAMNIIKDKSVCKIIGDGNLRSKYENIAGPNVEFLGIVPNEQMPEYYQQATVVVVPSIERVECFSIVAAEAQSCGIPVIVSDFPGARVTIENGRTGYVTRPGDPEELANRIQELLDNPQKARAMGMAGRERAVKLYDWRKIGDKLEKIYNVLIKN